MSENKVSFGEKDSGKPVDNAADDDIMEERDYIQNPDTGKMEGSTGGSSSGGVGQQRTGRCVRAVRENGNQCGRIDNQDSRSC